MMTMLVFDDADNNDYDGGTNTFLRTMTMTMNLLTVITMIIIIVIIMSIILLNTYQEGQPHHEPWDTCRTGYTHHRHLVDRYGHYHHHHQ